MSDPIYAGWSKRQWAKHERVEGDLLAALKYFQATYGDEKTLAICADMLDFHNRLRARRAELVIERPTESRGEDDQ